MHDGDLAYGAHADDAEDDGDNGGCRMMVMQMTRMIVMQEMILRMTIPVN